MSSLLGNTTTNSNFSLMGQGGYGGATTPNSAGLYLSTPVLPASLLYSQLYSSVSQNQLHLHGTSAEIMEQPNMQQQAASPVSSRALSSLGTPSGPGSHEEVTSQVPRMTGLVGQQQQTRSHADVAVWRPY
jgi:hypothetical protein